MSSWRQEGEELEELDDLRVLDLDEELVEFVDACPRGGEPDRAALGLAEFGAVGLGQQRRGEAARGDVAFAADEIDARRDVAPLVRAARLQEAAVLFVEVEKIVGLEQRVGKLGEADARLGFHPRLHAVLGHHGVDGKMLADVAQEIEHADRAHPVGVVEEEGLIFQPGSEVEQLPELVLDALDIGLENIGREEIALGRLAARVADHAGGAARDGDGSMARELEPAQDEQADQVAEVEAVGGGVEADVKRDRGRARREQALQLVAVGHVGDQPAPMEVFEDGRSGHRERLFND